MLNSVLLFLGLVAALIAVFVGDKFTFPLPSNRHKTQLRVNLDFNTALNLFLILCLGVTAAGVGYAFITPNQNPPATEFYLLTESESGEPGSGEYPTEFRPGQSSTLIVGITNNDVEAVDYTVVVALQRMSEDRTAVISSSPVHQFRTTVEGGETWRKRHQLSPEMTGTNLRIQYQLYHGEGPPKAVEAPPYRKLHLWIDLTREAD